MDAIDRKLIVQIQNGVPLTSEPFSGIAAELGISPQEVITRLKELQEAKVIRRFGVSLKPSGVGFTANALVAWKVPDFRITEVAQYFSSHTEVSHCYERETDAKKWPYNIYIVMHAHGREVIEELAKRFSEEIKIGDYLILYSTRNLKTIGKEETKC